MKFQNPSLRFLKQDGRTHARTSRNQYAPHFFQSWGHINPQMTKILVVYEDEGKVDETEWFL